MKTSKQKVLIGLTANIGSGKTTVRSLLEKYPGVTTIDTDTLAKEIAGLPEHTDSVASIVGFTVDFSKKSDRARLAQVLFSDQEIRNAYQAFMHPLVHEKVNALYDQVSSGLVFVESAILFETQSESRYDKIVMVTCDESVQIDRLCNGPRAMVESDVRARIQAQIPQSIKKSKADFCIDNSGTEEQLKEQVFNLYTQLQELVVKPVKIKALFVGSFDPPTLGHEWIVAEMIKRYDEVAVAVTVNPEKRSEFTLDERMEMLRAILPARVSIDSFSEMYSVNYAESIGATVTVRGIRNNADREYEELMAVINLEINPSVRTEFIESPEELRGLSSSLVKAMIGPKGFECGGWEAIVSKKVSPAVLVRLIAKRHDLFRDLQKLGAQGDEIEFWSTLVMPYLETDREYHAIGHIGDMLAEFKKVKHLCANPLAVEFAIWMHDYFNETMAGRHNNEERSGRKAYQIAIDLRLPVSFAEMVDKMILATKHNQLEGDPDTQILVDLDLLVFGTNVRLFEKYEDGIRTEYGWVDDEQFYPRRFTIMQQFANRLSVYYTEYFRSRYEDRAQENLSCCIKQLKEQVIRLTNT